MLATKLQQNLIDAALKTKENIVVEATAGSGKTTSLKLVTDALLKNNYNTKILAISYTNTIKNTLKEKLDDRVNILSIHQMGLSLLNSAFRPKFVRNDDLHGKNGSPDNKYKIIFNDIVFSDGSIPITVAWEYFYTCINLVNKIRLELIDENNEQEILRIVAKYHIEGVDDKVIGFVRTGLNIGLAYYQTRGWYDFIDMLYLPIKLNAEPRIGMNMGNKKEGFVLNKLDWILCDEFQDASVIIHKVIEKFQKVFKSRLLLVGDKNQSCFAFAAADTRSMDKAKTLFNCTSLPLNETFRCPESHVEFLNQRFGTNIISKRGKRGHIETIDTSKLVEIIKPGAMVLARTNQELMDLFLDLLRNEIPAKLIKFDLLKFFDDLIGQIEKKIGIDWTNPYLAIREFVETEFALYRRKYSRYRALELIAEMQSNVDILIAYIEFIKPTNYKMFMWEVEKLLDTNNKGNYVSLLNCHIGKGLEAENVFILSANNFPHLRDGMNSEDIQQETNLFFVACSRSLENLYLVNAKPKEKEEQNV